MDRIAVGAGHGGFDPGAISLDGKIHEADIALQIALSVGKKLSTRGHAVTFTRTSDTAPGGAKNKNAALANTVRISDNFCADYFIEIHLNAWRGTGAEVIVYDEGNNKGTEMAKRVLANLISIMGEHGKGNGIKDLDEINRQLYVIKNTKAPAMIVEVGYIDNPTDLNKVLNNIDAIAEAIASAFWGVTAVPVPAPKVSTIVDIKTDGAIKTLVSKGVISTPDYWLQNAMPGKMVKGEHVASLLYKLAEAVKK